jgi:hypothetical protein
MGLRLLLHGKNPEPHMSALGQKQTSTSETVMSALPPKADIARRRLDVRFVPKADIGLNYSPAVAANFSTTVKRPRAQSF